MADLDLDDIYNFTIKLARDVSTITVPHLPPPTFATYTTTVIPPSDAAPIPCQRIYGMIKSESDADIPGGRYDQSWTAETVRDGIYPGGEIEFC